jgi:RNA polymerase sigma-70 factor (ECF subfamily)
MYRIAKSYLRNDEDVADAIQDAILACFEKLHTLRSPEYFKTWLIKILINKCNNINKHEKRFVSLEVMPEKGYSDTGQSNVEFMMLVNSLDESYRDVLVLRYGECLSIRDISDVLGISESAVKKRLERSREKIKTTYISHIKREVGGVL